MAELDRLELEARKAVALASPLQYATYHNTEFLSPPHVQLMSDTIVRLTSDRLLKPDGTPYKRLMINMPPRHGKSELITRATPPWFLTKWPDKRVIVTGYESEFAADFGNDAKRYIASHPELGVTLDPSTSSKSNWGIEGRQGGLKTAGAGGAITGKGAHLFVIDDPVKGAEEADSDSNRAKLWTWWQGTIIPRLEPGGYIIMIMTRWHEDDIAGRCLLNEPEQWAQLSFPAISDHTEGLDKLGRPPGAPLWPERYDLRYLEDTRNGMGSRWWNAEYQQKPTIEGGNMFKAQDFRYWVPVSTAQGLVYSYQTPSGARKEVREDNIWKFTTLDLAATEKKTADFTVGAVWGVTPDRELLLLDLVRERMESAEHEAFVRRLGSKHKVRYHGVEKATYGLTLLQVCQRMGIPVLELKPDKDKVSRAWPAVGFIEHGAIYFPRSTPWLSAFELELQQFPNGANDDQVDVLAYAAKHLADRVRPAAREKPAEQAPGTVNVSAIVANRKAKLKIRNQSSAW
jgi:predicted phage terminase large subunit-like protein